MDTKIWSDQHLQDQARQAIFEAVTWHTVTLSPPRPVPIQQFTYGSGVCVEYAGRPFIATAKHVVDNIEALGLSPKELQVGSRSPKPMKLNYTGKIPDRVRDMDRNEARVFPIEDVSKSPHLDDLAVLRLRGAPSDYNPLRFHLIDDGGSSPSIGTGVLVVGHPSQELFTPDVGRKEVRWATGTYVLEAYVVKYNERGLLEFDPSCHYLVDFETGGDTKKYLQNPKGISGAGVWLLPPSVPRNQIWAGTRVGLVGIQSAWYKGIKLLKVIRIERLLALLKTATGAAKPL